MNIFILDENPQKCAEYHCDKHVVKMILETAQILCTVRHKLWGLGIKNAEEFNNHLSECEHCAKVHKDWEYDFQVDFCLDNINNISYKKTHQNHPCVLWAEKSIENYLWLCELGRFLSIEFIKRYKKFHKSTKVIKECYENLSDMYFLFEYPHMTPFALAMPEDVKTEDPVESYRNYYKVYKNEIADWNKGIKAPDWYLEK